MPFAIGLALIPVVLLLARAAESVGVGRRRACLLHAVMLLIVAAFFAFALLTRLPPFDFKISYSKEYMFFSGNYWIHALVIYVMTPFMWIVTVHFARRILRRLQVKKNRRIKRDKEFLCYRDDLDKLPPGVILFVAEMSVDTRRSVAAGLLKLKLSGHVAERGGRYIATERDGDDLVPSERLLLQAVKMGAFNGTAYAAALEAEALSEKYLVRHRGTLPLRALRILLTACIPVVLLLAAIRMDQYVHKHYWVNPVPVDGGYEIYIVMDREADLERLMAEVKDLDHLYGTYSEVTGQMHYIPWIKADRLEYGVVRKAYLLRTAGLLLFAAAFVSVFFSLYHVAAQIRHFRKNYRRTGKGNELLNKAYALKNYLKQYSLIGERGERELFLWEYYMVYAVALEVNRQLEDDVMKKFVVM